MRRASSSLTPYISHTKLSAQNLQDRASYPEIYTEKYGGASSYGDKSMIVAVLREAATVQQRMIRHNSKILACYEESYQTLRIENLNNFATFQTET